MQLISPARKLLESKAREARRQIEEPLRRVIRSHREQPEQFDDMLSMLLRAHDDSNVGILSDDLLLDECLTLFLAGHETTASALCWALYLLDRFPEVAATMRKELEEVLGGRLPTLRDVPELTYTAGVFREALRLYPPAWIFSREAITPYRLGNVEVGAGTTLLLSPYAMHRDPRFWDSPEEFQPMRWNAAAEKPRPFTYFPFGGGTRICIGEHFALMEGTLLLAVLTAAWRPVVLPDQTITPWPQLTLRPRHGIRAKVLPVHAAV